ncbi:MAG: DUF2961 domain-containing protein [Promethearchaeota archaeon]|nr:MAG: DUF2961 domain-containing protein [Candidatus Lokiarchaeota archaeon]
MKLGKDSINDIARLRPDSVKRRRISSHDISGGNVDWIDIKPKETVILGEFVGAGCIKHVWCTYQCFSRNSLRNAILRMYWDGENDKNPSVEVPLGDFFGMGHAKKRNYVSVPLQMSPRKGKGFNCWWPMPFSKSFRITLENDNEKRFRIFYYIDYEVYEDGFENEDKFGRFHAVWHRENPPKVKKRDMKTGKKFSTLSPIKFMFSGKNTEPLKYNYKILEAKGKGHYVGCHLDIDNITFMPWFFNWPGEGDDMIFIDDDVDESTPTLHGTGTEDYVNQAYSQRESYSAPYHGTIKAGGFNWFGKITYYRYHVEDPIYFNKKIIVSIEHGHDNHRKDDWSSTAYWYQKEPHDSASFPQLLDRNGRKPKTHGMRILRKYIGILMFILLIILIYSFLF